MNNRRLQTVRGNYKFEIVRIVCLYNPARKPGQCHKLHEFWTEPFKATVKLCDLNYEIISMNYKKQIVHINKLKKAYNPETWRPKPKLQIQRKQMNITVTQVDELEEDKINTSHEVF